MNSNSGEVSLAVCVVFFFKNEPAVPFDIALCKQLDLE